MADKPDNQQLEKPAGAATAKVEDSTIHVIPDKFYGAALKQKVKPELPPPVAPMAGTPVPPGQQPPQQQAPKKNTGLIIGIFLAVLLIGGGVVAYLVFFRKPPVEEPVCGDNICASPSETSASCPADCGPPPPVCGDGECAAAESPFTCAEDCGPPPPVCGNTRCEDGESPNTCPVDCGPPPAECGNNKCEEGEDYRSCPTDCEAPEPVVALDTDSDGITDVEEQQIYGSRVDDTDSDHDSFVDLNEILNLFDPAKIDPAKLIDAPGVTLYRNVDFGFDIYRPARWTVREDTATDSVTFNAPTGEAFVISVKEKAEGVELLDWVLEQDAGISRNAVEVLETKQDYPQVLTTDRRTAYIAIDGKVLVFTYDLGEQLEIRYRVTFTMMINSLVALGPDAAPQE